MNSTLFGQGILMGLSIAAPVGPIGVLCIRRTLTEGQISGFLSGLGAATADAIYGSVGAFGLTFVSGILVDRSTELRLIGGAFLCYLGIKTLLTPPADRAAASSTSGLWDAYISTVFLTLTNPTTILSFAAVFAGLGLAKAGSDYTAAIALVAGVFIGSALWWLLLSGAIGVMRSKFTRRGLQWLNRISGLLILGFGIFALTSAVVH